MTSIMVNDDSGTMDTDSQMMHALQEMRAVLEEENTALLKGDAQKVSALADEKLRISSLLDKMTPPQTELAMEIRMLGRQVRDLANSNHLLIEHMHQYYTGIMTLMIKLNGQTQTYGQHGYMSRPSKMQSPATRREIIA